MKKPMIKALACAMAFTLALSSPVAASAEGLLDIFTTSENADTKTKTNTNTNTNTNTTTNSEAPSIDEATYAEVIGIVLDKEEITLVNGKSANLKATILVDLDAQEGTGSERIQAVSLNELAGAGDLTVRFNGEEKTAADLAKELSGKLKWYVEPGSEDLVKVKGSADTAVVTAAEDAMGKAKVSVKLGETYKATATVTIKKYTQSLELKVPDDRYVKHVIDMNDYLTRDGNDALTWKVYQLNGAALKKTSAATITADGILTLKKATKEDQNLCVVVTSERGKTAKVDFQVLEGNPITKLVKDVPSNGKVNLVITADESNPEDTVSVKIDKVKYSDSDTTDFITWTSKNAKIATVEYTDNGFGEAKSATVKAVAPGKTTITAKSTSGKSVSFTVIVTAPLTAITGIEADRTPIYAGQAVQLTATKVPVASTDKISWKIEGADKAETNAMKKIASVNAKGVLQANKKNLEGEVRVVAYKKVSKTETIEYAATFKVEQSKITGITVTNPKANSKNKNEVTLYVTKTFPAAATAEGEGATADMLTWSSSNTKVATVDQNGKIVAKAAGKTTVTVSALGINPKNNKVTTYKKTIAVTVKQPITAIQLNKSDLTVNWKNYNDKNTKDYTVQLKVAKTFPKGAQKETYTWEVVEGNDFATVTEKGKVTIAKDAPNGTVVKVKATSTSLASAEATITVCNQTNKITTTLTKNKDTIAVDGAEYTLADKFVVTAKDYAKDVAADAEFNEEIISYTANNKNVVIEGDVLYAVKAGTTKVTAKTASGKSATITLTITE